MTRTDLIELISSAFGIPQGTVAEYAKSLSAAGMLTVGLSGPHGHGARMTTSDVVNVILACAVNSKRKESDGVLSRESAAERVRRVRNLRSDESGKTTASPADFVPDLPFFHADTAAGAIEAVIDAARTGLVVKWADHKNYFFNVTVENRGEYVLIGLNIEQKTAICGFGQPLNPLVERETRLSFMLLALLAKKLGPPDEEKARNA